MHTIHKKDGNLLVNAWCIVEGAFVNRDTNKEIMYVSGILKCCTISMVILVNVVVSYHTDQTYREFSGLCLTFQ